MKPHDIHAERRRAFKLVVGGQSSEGGSSEAGEHEGWDGFCEQIGWQQPDEPELPDDYEDQLLAHVFGSPLAGAQGESRAMGASSLSLLDAGLLDAGLLDAGLLGLADRAADGAVVRRGSRADQRSSWLAGLAVAAILAIAVVALLTRPSRPAAAENVPTRVPEQMFVRPTPPHKAKEKAPAPDEPQPDPGVAPQVHAHAVAPRAPRRPVQVRKPSTPQPVVLAAHAVGETVDDDELPVFVEPVWGEGLLAAERISPDGTPTVTAGPPVMLATLADHTRPERGSDPMRVAMWRGSDAAAGIPSGASDPRLALHESPWRAASDWYGVGMSAPREVSGDPAGFRVMAQVDIACASASLLQ